MKEKVLTENRTNEKLEKLRRGLARRFTVPIVRLIARTGVSPNTITWVGFLITVFAAIFAAYGYLLASGVTVILAGLFDTLDGALARETGRVTRFGGALDSILDRLSEGAVLVGITVFFLRTMLSPVVPVLVASLTLVGSYMVSYIRARAEGLGLKCEVGISTRPERVAITALGLIFNRLLIALVIVAVTSFFTAGQRLLYVWQQTKGNSH